MRIEPLLLDSSGIIAFLTVDDPHHRVAVQQLEALDPTGQLFVTTTAVICEIGDGFARRGRWDLCQAFLERLASDPLVEVVSVDVPLLQRALALKARRQDKRWGTADCVSFVAMAERGISAALTADRDFAQAGFRALLLDG